MAMELQAKVSLETMMEYCDLIHGSNLTTVMVTDEEGQLLYQTHAIDDENRVGFSNILFQELKEKCEGHPLIETFNSTYLYAFFPVFKPEELHYVIIGPALMHQPSRDDVEHIAPLYPQSTIEQLFTAAMFMPIYDFYRFVYVLQAMYYFVYNHSMKNDEIKIVYEQISLQSDLKKNIMDDIAIAESARQPSTDSYFLYEQELLGCLLAGDTERVARELSNPTIPPNYLLKHRHWREYLDSHTEFFVFATLVSRTAIHGGMKADQALSLEEMYARRCLDLSTPEEISLLMVQMLTDFTKRVASEIQKASYSEPIIRSMQYISSHVHDELSLPILASQVHLSPRYLSRIFKEEVGESIITYIQKQRVEEAKNMLRFTNFSYSEIANLLNFVSQSYFIKVFRQHVGETPQQFRNRF
ncbi:AraC family transcriptional regulator [Eubacteriales bacterium OttesenSCG-928-M02]|nr:AraC family transcriptional regulator [Eubacteriales bacterium OttesenSCG-928-M02]